MTHTVLFWPTTGFREWCTWSDGRWAVHLDRAILVITVIAQTAWLCVLFLLCIAYAAAVPIVMHYAGPAGLVRIATTNLGLYLLFGSVALFVLWTYIVRALMFVCDVIAAFIIAIQAARADW